MHLRVSLRQSGGPAREDLPLGSSPVVFLALDSLQLGSDDLAAQELRSSVAALERTGVPIVVWSGHTRAEIEMLRQKLAIGSPFVSENGAALFVPAGYFPFGTGATRRVHGYDVVEFGERYEDLLPTLRRVARATGVEIIALADMTIDEVARDFGLPLAGARLATLREYSELFRVVDDRPASRGRLFRGLHAAGMTCTHGERYELATGVNDRTAALQTVHRLFQRARGRVVRIGIGSHAGDLPVLAQADVRIVVRNGQSSITAPMIAHMPSVWVIEERGTEGWLQAIIRVTESLNRTAP